MSWTSQIWKQKPLEAATVLLITCLILNSISEIQAELAVDACAVDSTAFRHSARQKLREMFYHGYHSYKNNALSKDELQPLSCTGVDTFGGLQVTLIDSLDTLAVLGDWEEFTWAVKYIERTIPSFALETNVSVFETNIRVLGGLLSAHGLLTDAADSANFDRQRHYPDYNDGLLRLAVDLADRLLPAFNTPTGIPFGALNLVSGVWPDETTVASTAAAGGLLLEMGVLSSFTGKLKYYDAAFTALQALHDRAAWTGLVGNHIDIYSGEWVALESGVGALVDSYYEYMVKSYVLFGDERLMDMFWTSYKAVRRYIHKKPWYLPVDMYTGQTSSLGHCSLGAFWPGMQVLLGDIDEAIETTRAHYSVWRRYGSIPEGYQVWSKRPVTGQVNYPLRPELIESVFMLHWATNDSSWIGVAMSMMHSLETLTRVECGFARIKHVGTHEKEDLQDSFLLSETLKYLYLIFDSGHWIRSGNFVLSTEAHPLLITAKPPPGVPFNPLYKLPLTERSGKPRQNETEKHGNDSTAVASARKCPRRPGVSSRSRCGFGMPGTDHPAFNMSDVQSGVISEDVREMIQKRMTAGMRPLRVGEVFFGAETSYRVVRIAQGEVLVTGLDPDEVPSARRMQLEWEFAMVHASISHELGRPGFTPVIPMLQLLQVSHIWRSADLCDRFMFS